MKPAVIYAAVALGFLALVLLLRPSRDSSTSSGTLRLPSPPARFSPPPAEPAVASAGEERSTLADDLNAPTGTVERDLRIVAGLIEGFRSNFLRDGNPTGSNSEITGALAGRNRLALVLLPPDHPAINPKGELCDRWGTPFFFHAESANRMEVRSAGPDRKLWTDDDRSTYP